MRGILLREAFVPPITASAPFPPLVGRISVRNLGDSAATKKRIKVSEAFKNQPTPSVRAASTPLPSAPTKPDGNEKSISCLRIYPPKLTKKKTTGKASVFLSILLNQSPPIYPLPGNAEATR